MKIQSSLTAPYNSKNSISYTALPSDAILNLQNFKGTNAPETAPIRTNPVEAVATSSPPVPFTKQNPGAAATASGVDQKSSQENPEYLVRLQSARNLQVAIEACEPAIAAIIMDQELNSMRIGQPITALFRAMDEAVTWAAWATPAERKAYTLASYNAMSPKDQASFLSYVLGRAAA